MNINEIITEHVKTFDLEKVIKDELKSSLEKLVKDKIKEAFRSYGTLSEQLEKVLKDKLTVDFSKLHLDEYNNIMLDAVSDELAKYTKTVDLNARNLINSKIFTESRKEIPYNTLEKELTELIIDDWNINERDLEQVSESIYFETETDSLASSYPTGDKYKKIIITTDDNEDKDDKATICLYEGKVYHFNGNIDNVTRFCKMLKIRGTTITGI